MRRYTDEELILIAKQFQTKSEFKEKRSGAYKSAYERGILDEITTHMKCFRRKVTNDELIEKASHYKTRKELRENLPKDYNLIVQRGLCDEAFAHMEKMGNRYFRCVYCYEFLPEKVCYVGLTYCLSERSKQHKLNSSYSAVNEYCISKGIEPPIPKQLTDYIPKDEAAKKECEYISKYKEEGWVLLNREKGGGLGGRKNEVHTPEECKNLALKCENRTEFAFRFQSAYRLTKLMKWDDYVFSHFKRKRRKNPPKLYRHKKSSPKIELYTMDGAYISTFKNPTEASRKTNINKSTITRLINHESKTFIKGFYFKYENDNDEEFFKNLSVRIEDMKIRQYDCNMNVINVFDSAKEVSEFLDKPYNTIKIKLKGTKLNFAYGFYWQRFVEHPQVLD